MQLSFWRTGIVSLTNSAVAWRKLYAENDINSAFELMNVSLKEFDYLLKIYSLFFLKYICRLQQNGKKIDFNLK